MSASGKSLLGLWLYHSDGQEWAVKEGSPLHRKKDFVIEVPSPPSQKAPKLSKYLFQTEIEPSDRTSIIFTLKNEVGGLAKALQVFQELGINVLHLELRPSENSAQGDVLVDIDCDAKNLDQVLKMLRREVKSVNYAQTQLNSEEFPPPTPVSGSFGEKSALVREFPCEN